MTPPINKSSTSSKGATAGTPDPEGKALKCLTDQIFALEKRVEELTKRVEETQPPAEARTGT